MSLNKQLILVILYLTDIRQTALTYFQILTIYKHNTHESGVWPCCHCAEATKPGGMWEEGRSPGRRSKSRLTPRVAACGTPDALGISLFPSNMKVRFPNDNSKWYRYFHRKAFIRGPKSWRGDCASCRAGLPRARLSTAARPGLPPGTGARVRLYFLLSAARPLF